MGNDSKTFDLFDGPTPEQAATNGLMNGLIGRARGATAGHPLRSSTPNGSSELAGLRDAHAAALTEYEAAERSGDPERIAFAEHVWGNAFDELRAASGKQPRNEDGTFAVSFDGGVRGTSRIPRGVNREESPSMAFQKLIHASKRAREAIEAERTLT